MSLHTQSSRKAAKKHDSSTPKQDLGNWFDSWFQETHANTPAAPTQKPQENEEDLGTWFEALSTNPYTEPLQYDPLSESESSRCQEVDMTDQQIRDMWHKYNN